MLETVKSVLWCVFLFLASLWILDSLSIVHVG
jgi:preprotein translocase subunit SecE